MKTLRALAALLLGLWFVSGLLLFVFQRRFIFAAPGPTVAPVAPGARRLDLATGAGWSVAALHWPAPRGHRTVVHFHGNGEQLAWQREMAEAWRAAGYGVVAMEYPGYGVMADVAPSEGALLRAAETLLQHLETSPETPSERLILQGFSLGTGVAIEMARRGHGGALVLLAPYTSMREMAAQRMPLWPTGLMLLDRFESASRAPGVRQPVLLLHGAEDTLILPEMSERLARRFRRAERAVIDGAGHNDLFARGTPEIVARLARFAPPVIDAAAR